MATLTGTFTRRIYSSYTTDYHIFSFLDDQAGLVTVIYHGDKPPPLDKRMRVRGRNRESVDYGNRFVAREYREESDVQKMAASHQAQMSRIMRMIEA